MSPNTGLIDPTLNTYGEVVGRIEDNAVVAEYPMYNTSKALISILEKPRLVIEPEQFNKCYTLDVSSFVEKKMNLDYLSWAYAVRLLNAHFPELTYAFVEDLEGKLFSTAPDGNAYIRVFITNKDFSEATYPMFFPVIDNRNKPISNPTTMDLNTSRWRGVVKCIAITTGLGLTLYTQEEIPKEDLARKDLYKTRILKLVNEYKPIVDFGDNLLSKIKILESLSESELALLGTSIRSAIEVTPNVEKLKQELEIRQKQLTSSDTEDSNEDSNSELLKDLTGSSDADNTSEDTSYISTEALNAVRPNTPGISNTVNIANASSSNTSVNGGSKSTTTSSTKTTSGYPVK